MSAVISAAGTTAKRKRPREHFLNSVDTERNQKGNLRSLQEGRKNAAKRTANHLMEQSAQDQLRMFVEDNILSRNCMKYVPKSSRESTCFCGYSKQWHVKQQIDVDHDDRKRNISRGKAGIMIVSNPRNAEDFATGDKSWDESIHIADSSNWCYGVIQFSGFSEDESRHPVPYVRISTKSSIKPALQLLTEHWLLRRPKLVVSILGSDNNFFIREKEKDAFKKAVVDMIEKTGGLSKTAPGQESELSQGAWVITNGFGSGATQCVAEAINEYAARVSLVERLDIAVIGVCHWGTLDGTDMLTPSEKGGLFPAKYDRKIILKDANRDEKSPKILDCNHTHFILYDNGKGYDDKQAWRGELENFIASELLVIRRDQGMEWLKYPAVRLLVNADDRETKAAKQMYKLVPTLKIPLLILNDLRHLEKIMTKEIHGSLTSKKLPTKISAGTLVTTCTIDSESDIIDLKELVKNAILSLNHGSTPPQEVQGLMAAGLVWQGSEATDLNLSLQKIRSGHRVNELLMYSLINNQHEIVELILNSGADLEEFLTITTIKNLYLHILDNTDEDLRATFLRHLVMKEQKLFNAKDEWKRLKAIGCLLGVLMGHEYSDKYTAPWIENSSNEEESDKQGTWENSKLNSPHKHLMLWAILFNLEKMALLFWRSGKNHIGCALLAANLSKNLAQRARNMEMDDFFESYTSMARTFENQATNVLHNCYLQNTRLTKLCLIRSIHDLNHSTALRLAYKAKLTVFMDHVSYQQQLNSIWMGSISPKTHLLKLALVALLPLILIRFLRFVRPSLTGHYLNSVPNSDVATSTETMRADSEVPETLADAVSIDVPPVEQRNWFGLFAVCEKPDRRIRYGKALRIFFNAPATKFVYSMMSYFAFLVVFSIFLLREFAQWTGPASSRFEIVVWIWAVAVFAEALLQKVLEKNMAINRWNKLDILTFFILILSLFLRFFTVTFVYGRMAYAISGSLLIARCLRAFRAFESLGPKLIILQKMVRDVAIFIGILAVFLVSFGISYRALQYPKSKLNIALLENILYNAYFIIFGQVPVDEIIGGTLQECNNTIQSSTFGDGDACPQATWLAELYLAVYCFIANILLINLLIAMFNFSFKKVQVNSTRLWKYQRFSLVQDFYHQPVLSAPLNLPYCLYKLLQLLHRACGCCARCKSIRCAQGCCARCKSKENIPDDDFERKLTAEETRQVLALERRAVEQVTALSKENSLTITQRSLAVQEKLDKVLAETKQMQSLLDTRHRQSTKKTQTETVE